MDHSYRTVNGNVADGPPSTIPTAGNGHHGYYSDVNVGSPTVPVKADAPTRIFCFIDDLFFQAKIQETAKKLGVKVEFVKGEKETISRIIDSPEAEKPTLVVFDLNNLNAKPMTLIPKFKTKFKKATSIIGFLNHLQGDLKMKAIEAGCDTVMPRSAFSQSLPNLLRRYGLEEEDEYVPQPRVERDQEIANKGAPTERWRPFSFLRTIREGLFIRLLPYRRSLLLNREARSSGVRRASGHGYVRRSGRRHPPY